MTASYGQYSGHEVAAGTTEYAIPVMCTAVLINSLYPNFPALVATSIVAVTTLVSRDAYTVEDKQNS